MLHYPTIREKPLKFHGVDTCDTAIVTVSQSFGFPKLDTEVSVIENAKNLTLAILNAQEAFKLIQEINYDAFTPEKLAEIYYYLECSLNSNDIIDFLDSKGVDVVFIEIDGKTPGMMLKIGNVFFSPPMGMTELKRLEAPNIAGQKTEYYAGVYYANEKVLLRLHPGKSTFESYVGEEQKLGIKQVQFIQNINGNYDVINTTDDIIYNLDAFDFEGDRGMSVRFFLNIEKTIFVDYDGEEFGDLIELDISKSIDFTGADDKIKKVNLQ